MHGPICIVLLLFSCIFLILKAALIDFYGQLGQRNKANKIRQTFYVINSLLCMKGERIVEPKQMRIKILTSHFHSYLEKCCLVEL